MSQRKSDGTRIFNTKNVLSFDYEDEPESFYVHSPHSTEINWSYITSNIEKNADKTNSLLDSYKKSLSKMIKIKSKSEFDTGPLKELDLATFSNEEFDEMLSDIFSSAADELNKRMNDPSFYDEGFLNAKTALEGQETLLKLSSELSQAGKGLVEQINKRMPRKNNTQRKSLESISKNEEFLNFMGILGQVLELIGNIPKENIQKLTEIYGEQLRVAINAKKRYMKKGSKPSTTLQKKIDALKKQMIVSGDDIKIGTETLDKIALYLGNILNNVAGTTTYKYESLRSSLTHIMSTATGEKTGAIIQDMLLDVDNQITSTLAGEKTKTVGALHNQFDETGKVDISSPNGKITFSITTGKNQGIYVLEGELNSSVKFYNSLLNAGNLDTDKGKSINIANTSARFVQWCKEAFNVGSDRKTDQSKLYSIYNTIVFQHDTPEAERAYRMMTAYVIDNKLAKFLAGSGTKLKNSDITDLNLFLKVNEKYYSVFEILYKYIQNIKNSQNRNFSESNRQNNIFYITSSRKGIAVANKWQGSEERSTHFAGLRSLSVRKAVEAIGASVEMNYSKLQVLLNTTGVQPINKA